MKFLLVFTLATSTLLITAQKKDMELFNIALEDGTIQIYARNNTNILHSLKVEFVLNGMKASEELPITKLCASKSEVFVTSLKPIKNTYSFNTRFSYIKGDVTATHDNQTVYQLPFQRGEKHHVDQGYNERPTHMNKYALDFHMDEGTQVCAIRSGVVFEVVERHTKGCPDVSCSQYNNFVSILHDDGSLANYSHIRKNGVLVSVGDQIKAGDVVALSGSTGHASGPHLHLEVYVMRLNGQESIKANYQINNTVGIPRSGHTYMRN